MKVMKMFPLQAHLTIILIRYDFLSDIYDPILGIFQKSFESFSFCNCFRGGEKLLEVINAIA